MPDTRSQRNQASGDYARFVGLGFTFMFIIAAFTVGGYLLDRLSGTLPLVAPGRDSSSGFAGGDVLPVREPQQGWATDERALASRFRGARRIYGCDVSWGAAVVGYFYGVALRRGVRSTGPGSGL